MNDYQNQPIVNWAKQNLQNGYDANRFDVMIIVIIYLIFQTVLCAFLMVSRSEEVLWCNESRTGC